MARLLADEDFHLQIAEALRGMGHDLLTLQEAGYGNQRMPDSAVLAYALAESRVVLTHNRRDYKRLHRSGVTHAGIVAVPQDPDLSGAAQRIQAELEARDTCAGELILVNCPFQ